MVTEAVAYDMGERTAIHGLDFNGVVAGLALGETDSAHFERIYAAFEAGNANGVLILDKFLKRYKGVK